MRLMIFKSSEKFKSGGSIVLLPVSIITPNPNQPRKSFDYNELENLASSIRNNGIIQPLIVRRKESDRYELISGERRLRASKLVGLSTVPCIIMSADDNQSALYAIIENIQRENLHFFEEAESISRLSSLYSMSQTDIASKLGKSQSCISNKLRLLTLTSDMKCKIIENELSERHARALLKIKSDEKRMSVLDHVIEKKLSVSETEKYIDSLFSPAVIRQLPKLKKLKDIKIFVNTINHAVDTMRKAGINADSHSYETTDYYEYVVRIPKNITSSPVNISDYSVNAV